MRKLIIAAVASTALVSTTAFAAPTDSVSFDINANVNQECSVDQPADFDFGDVAINEDPGANALLIDGDQAATTQTIWVSCNYNTDIELESLNTGLLNAAGAADAANDPGDFTNVIHYRLRLISSDGVFPDLRLWTATDGDSDSVNAGGAFHDNSELRLRIETDDNPLRPVAGTYTDVATINLGPV